MINNKGNINIIINQSADFWFYIIGVNIIPFDIQKGFLLIIIMIHILMNQFR